MSSSNSGKPATTGTSGRSSPLKGSASPGSAQRTKATGTPSATNGVTRSGSVRTSTNGTPISARASVRKPATSSTINTTRSAKEAADDDARAQANNLIEELKAQLQKTEEASEQYHRQIQTLQSRLDDALIEQSKLEERLHEEEERVEGLENEKRESINQKRELERIYEAERAQMMKDREETHTREEEMQAVIQRLKDSLSQRESRSGLSDDGRLSRTSSSPSLEPGQFAPPSLQRSNSTNNSKLLLQKDKLIEDLRLELAEAEIKLAQMENAGGGRIQELERQLLEIKVTNARLMEETESYQLLLSEKTLKGNFSTNDMWRTHSSFVDQSPPRNKQSSSLADELSEAVEAEQGDEDERVNRLEAENASLKEEKKALSLYIEKIIERILKHQGGFETILSNTDDDESSSRRSKPSNKDKDLPPPPPKENTASQQTLLQRASSVVRRQRPQSMMPTTQPTQGPTSNPTVNENPATAPSIPLKRTQSNRISIATNRRSGADWNPAAATVVGNMYRGGDNMPASPGAASQRNSFFAFQRTPSGSIPPADIAEEQEPEDARKAALDALTGGGGSEKDVTDGNEDNTIGIDTPSPPRSLTSAADMRIPQSVMSGNKPRPLRLVQENVDDAAQKQANRSSWLPTGWFGNQS